MSFFHVNVKSLPKYYDELDLYLNSLDMKFSFLVFSETWLNEANNELYGWPDFNCISKYGKGRKVGGDEGGCEGAVCVGGVWGWGWGCGGGH